MKLCNTCNNILPYKMFYKNSHMADNHLNDCKICFKLKTSTTAHKESKIKATKGYRDRNRELLRQKNKEYRDANKQLNCDRLRSWRLENPGLSNHYKAKRRATKRLATPFWSETDLIKEVYIKARALTESTGISYQVDHIVPLCNELVCGLHVIANLQILPWYENASKHNKLIEDIV